MHCSCSTSTLDDLIFSYDALSKAENWANYGKRVTGSCINHFLGMVLRCKVQYCAVVVLSFSSSSYFSEYCRRMQELSFNYIYSSSVLEGGSYYLHGHSSHSNKFRTSPHVDKF